MEISKNVDDILIIHATEIANLEGFAHKDKIECLITENNITSPIEQVLYSALITERKYRRINLPDLVIHPQEPISSYRVDFLVLCFLTNKSVVIECDSQEFHDRTQEERACEKKRDRFLQKNNYKVFRYTGTEIIKSSLGIAGEIIDYLMEE